MRGTNNKYVLKNTAITTKSKFVIITFRMHVLGHSYLVQLFFSFVCEKDGERERERERKKDEYNILL